MTHVELEFVLEFPIRQTRLAVFRVFKDQPSGGFADKPSEDRPQGRATGGESKADRPSKKMKDKDKDK